MIVIEETKIYTDEEWQRIMEQVRPPLRPGPSIRPTLSGHYVVFVHPETLRIVRMWEAKRKWKERYRAERIARRVKSEG